MSPLFFAICFWLDLAGLLNDLETDGEVKIFRYVNDFLVLVLPTVLYNKVVESVLEIFSMISCFTFTLETMMSGILKFLNLRLDFQDAIQRKVCWISI